MIWMLMSILIDMPLMRSPPVNYTPAEYFADVGLTYMMIPIITTGLGIMFLLGGHSRTTATAGEPSASDS